MSAYLRALTFSTAVCLVLARIDNKCGQNVTQEGTIESPGYPNYAYAADLWCQWTVRAPRGLAAVLTIMDLRLEENQGKECHYDWLSVSTDSDRLSSTKICQTFDEGRTFVASHGFLLVTFRSDGYYTNRGFRASLKWQEPESILGKSAVFQPAARTKFGRATLPVGEVPLENITFCIDIKLTAPRGNLWTAFSYIEPEASKLSLALSGGADGQLILNIANSKVTSEWNSTAHTWHQVCAIWQGAEGLARLFVDGKMTASWVNVSRNANIKGGGSVFLGQHVEVKKERIQFRQPWFFQGELVHLRIWPDLVCGLSSDTSGNLLPWSADTWEFHNIQLNPESNFPFGSIPFPTEALVHDPTGLRIFVDIDSSNALIDSNITENVVTDWLVEALADMDYNVSIMTRQWTNLSGIITVVLREPRQPCKSNKPKEIPRQVLGGLRRRIVEYEKNPGMSLRRKGILLSIRSITHADSCIAESWESAFKGVYEWPETPGNQTAEMTCIVNPTQNGSRACSYSIGVTVPMWEEPDLSLCENITVPENDLFFQTTFQLTITMKQQNETELKNYIIEWLKEVNIDMDYTMLNIDIKEVPAGGRAKRSAPRHISPTSTLEGTTTKLAMYTIEITLLVKSNAMEALDEEKKRLEIEKEINNTLSNSSDRLKIQLHAEYVGVKAHKVATPGSCPENNIWKETKSNSIAYVNCSKIPNNLGIDKLVSRECIMDPSGLHPIWRDSNEMLCFPPSSLTSDDVSNMVNELYGLIDFPSIPPDRATTVVTIISSILDAPAHTLHQSSEKLINLVDSLGQKLDVKGLNMTIASSNLALTVVKMDPGAGYQNLTFVIHHAMDNLQVSLVEEGRDDLKEGIHLPASLLKNMDPAKLPDTPRTQFAFFNQANIFQGKRKPSSKVMSASIGNSSIKDLGNSDRIRFVLKHEVAKKNANRRCVFWSLTEKDWKEDGCRVENESNSEMTVCSCDHLTHFAVLLDFMGKSDNYTKEQKSILTIITHIGCGISAIFLALTLLTYLFLNKLRKDHPSKILLNLCLALFMLNLMFLLNSWFAMMEIPAACTTIAAILHYFLLASITWMGLEAAHLYIVIIRVFNTYVRHYILKFFILGWGIPAVIVGVVLAVDVNQYNFVADDFCFLKPGKAFYVSILAYFCVVYLFNICMFCIVLRQICRQKRLHKDLSGGILRDLKSIFSLTFLLGITWGIAFFSMNTGNNYPVVVDALFALFNSFQGLFIFIFHCAMRENVRTSGRDTCAWIPFFLKEQVHTRRASCKRFDQAYLLHCPSHHGHHTKRQKLRASQRATFERSFTVMCFLR
uniref:adhesion G-protein coupled receptor G6-like isoform X2 n=1 Tax=Myxine glutinosa TaxID=7769 RepID=UPI00358F49E7